MRMGVFMKKLRVEIENEMRVFLETLDFEIEMRVSQKSAPRDPPAASNGHKGRKGRNFFLAQTVPFDPSVDPWWSLIVSGLLGTLQQPHGRKGRNNQLNKSD